MFYLMYNTSLDIKFTLYSLSNNAILPGKFHYYFMSNIYYKYYNSSYPDLSKNKSLYFFHCHFL